MNGFKKGNLTQIVIAIAFVTAVWNAISQLWFVTSIDGQMSTETAMAVGLTTEKPGPFTAPVMFKALPNGAYEIMEGRDFFGVSRKKTGVDIARVCKNLGGCGQLSGEMVTRIARTG